MHGTCVRTGNFPTVKKWEVDRSVGGREESLVYRSVYGKPCQFALGLLCSLMTVDGGYPPALKRRRYSSIDPMDSEAAKVVFFSSSLSFDGSVNDFLLFKGFWRKLLVGCYFSLLFEGKSALLGSLLISFTPALFGHWSSESCRSSCPLETEICFLGCRNFAFIMSGLTCFTVGWHEGCNLDFELWGSKGSEKLRLKWQFLLCKVEKQRQFSVPSACSGDHIGLG